MAERLVGSLQLDSSPARQLLGWEPKVSVEEALRSTAMAFLAGRE